MTISYLTLLNRLHFFFFNDTATTEIYTLSLHDALPISGQRRRRARSPGRPRGELPRGPRRSEEHTSELQSQSNLVCRLLLEKKKQNSKISIVARVSGTHRNGEDWTVQRRRRSVKFAAAR